MTPAWARAVERGRWPTEVARLHPEPSPPPLRAPLRRSGLWLQGNSPRARENLFGGVKADPGWDPAKYLEFAGPRLRPALDLLARVPLAAPATVYDLGCGAGNVTRLLAERWPAAAVTGIDGSPSMLATARAALPAVAWKQADLATWHPPQPADLLFSNAALHWLDGHRALFPRLVGDLAPAASWPSRCRATTARRLIPRWSPPRRPAPGASACARPSAPRPVGEPAVYHDILAPHVSRLDIWETEYLHVLEGDNPVVEWTRGSALNRFSTPSRSRTAPGSGPSTRRDSPEPTRRGPTAGTLLRSAACSSLRSDDGRSGSRGSA